MLTYFIYGMFIKELLIEDLLIYGDDLSKAVSIVALPFFAIIGILFIAVDIIFIPVYLLVGFVWLIIKIIKIIIGDKNE